MQHPVQRRDGRIGPYRKPAQAVERPATAGAITDETVCARTPEPFSAVGEWYDDFSQTTDEDVRELLLLSTVPR